MKPNLEVHPVQGKILRVLLFQTEATFSQLNPDKIPSDHFNFHLKALLESDLLGKTNSGQYKLTSKGKEFANRFDTEKIVIERQAKLSIAVVPIKNVGKKKYYLIHQRLKQPYFGYYGVVNGKIRWGEKIFEGFTDGSFIKTIDGKKIPISCDPGSPNHYPEWRKWVIKMCPDILERLCLDIFEGYESEATQEGPPEKK